MTTWHARIEYTGQPTTEQLESIVQAVFSAAHRADTGQLTLRFDLPADTLADAVQAALTRSGELEPVRALLEAGVLTGPHRIDVADEIAHARTLPIVGVAEGATLMDIGPARFRQLRDEDPDFPAPVLPLASADLWDADQLLTYNRTRVRGKPGRPRKQ